MKTSRSILYIVIFLVTGGCSKSDFLDKKPITGLTTPHTLADYQALLENTNVLNYTGALAQLASDDYIVPTFEGYQTASAVERNSYIWAKDTYEGTQAISDWNKLYQAVFYCNNVLDGLAKSDSLNTAQGQYLKGWALFSRAFAFYDLTRNFCKGYDAGSANTDPGIPLRLSSGIDYTVQRATLKETFDQIIGDLNAAEPLLPSERPSANLNRPSKIAVYALLARIYLDMRDYAQAGSNAAKCLSLYSKLIDYNTVSKTSATPFSATNDELILNVAQVSNYSGFSGNASTSVARISPEVIALYNSNDLRLSTYFNRLADGFYTKKRGYVGSGLYPFTGLATDEVYLIRAECLARDNQTGSAMDLLNQLLAKRWNPDASVPAKPFEKVTAGSPAEALQKILLERRKELVWRGLRWHDLKRLNKEGANITLTRSLNGESYTLPPNDPRYVFPIPDDEITLSGIQQNIR